MKLISLFFISSAVFAQSSVVTYRDYPSITWQDFRADVPLKTSHAASISTGMHYKWSCSYIGNKINLEYDIQSELNRSLSWSKYKKEQKEILKHEQLHYDITELYTRKLRKAFSEYTPVIKTLKKDLEQIYNRVEQERQNTQDLYDKQTNHSINTKEQKKWEFNVASWLIDYQEYR